MVRSGGCQSSSHRVLKKQAKNRVDDLQGMFTDIQLARKESRTGDVVVLEEQVHQMLREWKAELNTDSPASSSSIHPVQEAPNMRASSDLSSEIRRLLLVYEEEDDATSRLADLSSLNPKPEPAEVPEPEPDINININIVPTGCKQTFVEQDFYVAHELPNHGFIEAGPYQSSVSADCQPFGTELDGTNELGYQNQFILHQDSIHMNQLYDECAQNGEVSPHISELMQAICPPPAAFLRPKCALWDCARPAQACQDYCNTFHATLALNEGTLGRTPVLRPGGIDLKDGPLFAAIMAKVQGKSVGIPECEGAATSKSPWNAPEFFDLLVLEGETLREWLFFDKPRRAFESGNRKQRSLPDYSGRGWHESRKQVMKEFGGLKRSYYMDPQPQSHLEWHLYEYEINNCDACALYRLELKFVDPKKNTRGKVSNDFLVDLQQQLGRLNAASTVENKRPVKGRAKAKQEAIQNSCSGSEVAYHRDKVPNIYPYKNVMPADDKVVYGPSLPYDFPGKTLTDYYGT